jgi:UDPglucose 6-dehydrogenase
VNLIVVGTGYVGLVAAYCLANSGHQVTYVETDKGKLSPLNQVLSPNHKKLNVDRNND